MEQNNNTTNKFRNMNNKKVVRLTESQLHNIIAESVSQILMEMDPRTYASAAEKRRLQGNKEKAKKLHNTAIDSFNKEFGKDDLRLISDFGNYYSNYEYPLEYTIQGRENFDDDSHLTHNYTPSIFSHPVFDDDATSSRYPGHKTETWSKKKAPYLAPKSSRKDFLGYDPMSSDDDAHKATEKFIINKLGTKGLKVVKDMNKRNGKYIKGQGWQ